VKVCISEEYFCIASFKCQGAPVFKSVIIYIAQGFRPVTVVKSGKLSIYPNPASDQVKVCLPDWETGIITIEISDLTGKSLSVESFDPGRVQTINPDIRGLSPGIYVLKASTARSSYSQKLVVLR